MSFTNVRLILAREVRDQLRDRRTLFMMFVLPVLLYPLLGTAYFEMVQFQTQKTMNVLVVGGGQLAKAQTPLIEDGGFAPALFPDGINGSKLLNLKLKDDPAEADAARMVPKEYDAAVIFPPDFEQRLDEYRKAIQHETGVRSPGFSRKENGIPAEAGTTSVIPEIPRPKIIYTAANERSVMACSRLTGVLDRWTEEVGKTNLAAGGLPEKAVRPFEIDSANLAGVETSRSSSVWSRMLPIMLLLWAMTGAFYPAIDVCAGEKERGTLETLLSSPAERSEIVLGKLLTIMAFSMVTAALNLICVGVTGCLIFRQMAGFGGPPLLAILWLSLAMLPVSALFSALCLALASFARSTKEGQYYLMPLLMMSLPLAVLPMSPGVELNVGNALIPISGLVLLLKTLLEGAYLPALQYAPIVLAVTFSACWLSVRWAVEQFNSESVLFRENERFAVGLWFKQLRRDREPTPSAAEGMFCGVVILALAFVFRASVPMPQDFIGFAKVTAALQLAVILTPALLMAVVLTGSPRRTLLLTLPRWKMIPAAAVLAIALHPFVMVLEAVVTKLYPISPEFQQALEELQHKFNTANVWTLVLLVAALPAVCEELAFRGFVLSGCRKLGNNGRAIVVSAVFFGVAHGILQQSINACIIGLVLGYLAIRSNSILPGMIFHFLHNAMLVLGSKITSELIDRYPGLVLFVHSSSEGPVYQWPVYLICGVTSLAVLGWFTWYPEARNAEELLQEAYRSSDRLEGAVG